MLNNTFNSCRVLWVRILKKKCACVIDAANHVKGSPEERILSPFYRDATWQIPVPGQERIAHSVEGVWQGLKLVDGKTDFDMFTGKPHKRPWNSERLRRANYRYEDSQFTYHDEIVDLVTARRAIYVPTYTWFFDNIISGSFKDRISDLAEQGEKVMIFDWDDNPSIYDTSTSFAHGSLLAILLQDHFLSKHNTVRMSLENLASANPLDIRENLRLRYADIIATLLGEAIRRKDIHQYTAIGNNTSSEYVGEHNSTIILTPDQDIIIQSEDPDVLALARNLNKLPHAVYGHRDINDKVIERLQSRYEGHYNGKKLTFSFSNHPVIFDGKTLHYDLTLALS